MDVSHRYAASNHRLKGLFILNRLKTLAVTTTLALCAAMSAPAEAAQILTFGIESCETSQGGGCRIAQSFGDTAQIDIAYRSLSPSTGVTFQPGLNARLGSYGDLTGVAFGNVGMISEITLKAAEGFGVSLLDFDLGTYGGASASTPVLITDLMGNTLSAFRSSTGFPKHTNVSTNTDYLSGVILRWGPDGYNVGVNNIRYDLKSTLAVGAVPEPSTWAMLILGFAGVGAIIRRRRSEGPLFA